jgi:23S rRNA pseudouridine2605 synthase
VAQERLQKILARAGLTSRRGAEEWIESGKVKVNGKVVTELGAKADPRNDKIEVNGKIIAREAFVYVLFHKPRGVVCTMSDPEGRPTVAQYVADVEARIVPVGRLDFHTSGVLLMTNDGDFAEALAHPRRKVKKVYVAKLRGIVDDEMITKLGEPLDIDGKVTQPANVRRLRVEGDKTWVEFTLREGRNRQIHRITEAAGTAVFRLARVEYAGLDAEGLRPGQWRYLTKDELKVFKAEFGLPKKLVAPPRLPDAEKVERTRRRMEKVGEGQREERKRLAQRSQERTADEAAIEGLMPAARGGASGNANASRAATARSSTARSSTARSSTARSSTLMAPVVRHRSGNPAG